jgi:hypothetical protein
MPLPREHLLDELATAYIQALVATAGATIAISKLDYGVDGTLSRIIRARKETSTGYKFVPDGFPVDFQLKGTTVGLVKKGHIAYDLKVRSYNLIVTRSFYATPLYLFLVCFDSRSESWIGIENDHLILRASAYWWRETSIQSRGSTTVRIRIPAEKVLTVEAVEGMLQTSKNRFSLT